MLLVLMAYDATAGAVVAASTTRWCFSRCCCFCWCFSSCGAAGEAFLAVANSVALIVAPAAVAIDENCAAGASQLLLLSMLFRDVALVCPQQQVRSCYYCCRYCCCCYAIVAAAAVLSGGDQQRRYMRALPRVSILCTVAGSEIRQQRRGLLCANRSTDASQPALSLSLSD